MAARVVDLGGNTSSVIALAEEFMAQDAPVAHVATGELDVGVADPGAADAEEDFSRSRFGPGKVAAKASRFSVAKDAEH
jgi:hypothetical protein